MLKGITGSEVPPGGVYPGGEAAAGHSSSHSPRPSYLVPASPNVPVVFIPVVSIPYETP